jgi:hypothetical protein
MSQIRVTILLLAALIPLTNYAQQSRPRRTESALVKTNIRQVDFENFTYRIDGKAVRVRDGVRSVEGRNSISVERVTYGDLTGDGKDEAAIVIEEIGWGGTGVFSCGYIYTLQNGRVRSLTRFEGGDRADGGIVDVKIQSGLLIVERNEPERVDGKAVGLCCPKYVDTTTYRWNGHRLIQVGDKQRRRSAKA